MSTQTNRPTRPPLPHEHPTWRDNWRYFCQNIRWHTVNRKPLFTSKEAEFHTHFAQNNRRFSDDIAMLSDYFTASFAHHAYGEFSHARFSGLPGILGRDSDGIEGASRSYPLLAVRLRMSGGRDEACKMMLRKGFLAATDPNGAHYWGKLQSFSQTVCEAADFALALWLTKQSVWTTFSEAEKNQILTWLRGINRVETVDNNWHLFVILVQLVIKDFSGEDTVDWTRYDKIKSFYAGAGWFRDGNTGNFDYYNTWGFHYPLFWIQQIAPDTDRDFIHEASATFCQSFKYLFAPDGFAFFGRSAPYRFAAPAALISNAILQGRADGQSKRIVRLINECFIRRGAIQTGTFTQGIFAADRRLLDGYSGSGSALWSLRTLILLIYSDFDWDNVAEEPLEVEKSDYVITVPEIPLKIIGSQESGEVVAILMRNEYPQVDLRDGHLIEQGWWAKVVEQILGRTTRPKNNLIRKGVTTYSSKFTPFL